MTGTAAPVRSVRALAYDGDADFVVERAANPPASADARFREAAEPVAARVAEQVRIARDLLAGAALDIGARAAVGQGLKHVVGELRALAESYDVAPVADVCRAREAGAATLDPRAVAGIEYVAHALLGAAPPTTDEPAPHPPIATEAEAPEAPEAPNATAPGTPAPNEAPPDEASPNVTAGEGAPDPVVLHAEAAAPFRPPTGPALVELLEHGITGIGRWPGTPLDMPAVPAPAIAPETTPNATPPAVAPAPDADGVVPIAALLYRGRAALDRARAVRDELRAADGAPDPALLAELFDLLDLAAD